MTAKSRIRESIEEFEGQLQAANQITSVIATILSVRRRFPEIFDLVKHEIHAAIDDDPTEPQGDSQP